MNSLLLSRQRAAAAVASATLMVATCSGLKPDLKADMPQSLAAMAVRGDLDGIMATADHDPRHHNDAMAYRWLAVAHDHGHARAAALMDELLSNSSLRYDDELVVGPIHYELAIGYLTGDEGSPLDLAKARRHLERSKPRVLGVDIDLEVDRRKLRGEALAHFDSVFPADR